MGARIDLALPRQRMRVESVQDHPDVLDQRGIYVWYADARARARLRRARIPVRDDRPVYVGWATGRGGFRERVLHRHINGNSTLRKTLRSILVKIGSAAARADAEVGRFHARPLQGGDAAAPEPPDRTESGPTRPDEEIRGARSWKIR